MNQELVITWTPILKELPDDQRERARQLIERYGETSPTNFIVELLEVFGIHAAYLQTVPAQVRIAGERAKAEIRQSLDAVTTLHERTRLELNEMVSTVSRTGASFTKALDEASREILLGRSILVRHQYGDGGLRVAWTRMPSPCRGA